MHRFSSGTGVRRAAALGLAAAVAVLGGAAAAVGCSGKSGATTGTAEMPKIDVSLPSPPKVPPRKYPVNYPDGSISVEEALRNADKYLKKDVKVKGVVVWKSECEKCPKGKTCTPCDMPNLLVADKPDEPRLKLMVVDFIREEFDEVEVGHNVNVNGTFARTSRTGFVNKEGLVGFRTIEDLDSKPPGKIIGATADEGAPGAPGAPGMPPPTTPMKPAPGVTP
ncbi:MAG TPA: hypothetical protein VG389_08575 [Myxococcota bacterium]|jgi:hypothetical protein|nr:hypothetical protein [Myxococcota bacterium]